MSFLVDHIQWVMLAAGVLTLTLVQGLFAPASVVRTFFGEELASPAFALVVRNWSFVIVTTAIFLIYAAFADPLLRVAAITISGAGKLCFVALVFSGGARYARSQAFVAAAVDLVFIALFSAYLAALAFGGHA